MNSKRKKREQRGEVTDPIRMKLAILPSLKTTKTLKIHIYTKLYIVS